MVVGLSLASTILALSRGPPEVVMTSRLTFRLHERQGSQGWYSGILPPNYVGYLLFLRHSRLVPTMALQ